MNSTYENSYARVKENSLGIYEKKYVGVHWKLLEYVSPMNRAMISTWRADLSVTRRADFDAFILDMAKTVSWAPPDIGHLHGKQQGYKELRWRSQGVPHRIGGYYSADNEFVMLIGFTHNKKKYDPADALQGILDRRRLLLNNEAKLREYPVITSQ